MSNKYISLGELAVALETSTDNLKYIMKDLKLPTVLVPTNDGAGSRECIYPMDAVTVMRNRVLDAAKDIQRIEKRITRYKDYIDAIA